jgi:hypothetical protein
MRQWEAGQSLLINRSVQAAVMENGNRMILAKAWPTTAAASAW